MNPDVVVISAGIGGTSCAYYLAQSGLKVHLVEKVQLVLERHERE
jgi:phytoene dehydrogenase-like protein